MSSVETLEAAIARLEELKAESTPGEWWTTRDLKWPGVFAGPGLSADVLVADEFRLPGDAQLVVTLSRTVDPILDMLRFARGLFGAQIQGEQAAATVDLALYLARAILGEVGNDE